ncbi:MAG: 30S ribosomal protein S20 [bacterium]|nr:30S ribosomal protein S20 [bacterium]
MPNIKSAKKALRQSIRRRARNLKRTDAYKTVVKKIKRVVATGEDKALDLVSPLYKALDKAAKTRAISKNKANRLKSRMTKLATGEKKK